MRLAQRLLALNISNNYYYNQQHPGYSTNIRTCIYMSLDHYVILIQVKHDYVTVVTLLAYICDQTRPLLMRL